MLAAAYWGSVVWNGTLGFWSALPLTAGVAVILAATLEAVAGTAATVGIAMGTG